MLSLPKRIQIDQSGRRYGCRVVLSYVDGFGARAMWKYKCDCGRESIAAIAILRKTKSCGCSTNHWNKSSVIKKQPFLGMGAGRHKEPEYNCWRSIQKRCHYEKDRAYKYYGARGIFVCDRWRESYVSFIEDMGRRPSSEHSIERRDVNGGYTPENCYWATDIIQANNKRTNRRIEYNGEILTMAQFSRKINIHRDTVRKRLDFGWDIERVANTPLKIISKKTRRP